MFSYFHKLLNCNDKFAANNSFNGRISSDHEKKSYKCQNCTVIFAENISFESRISSDHEKQLLQMPNL